MRLCNADVDEAERNPAEFEDFDEPEDEDGGDGGADTLERLNFQNSQSRPSDGLRPCKWRITLVVSYIR